MRFSRIFGIWVMLAGLMVCNGVLRVVFLNPVLGQPAGEMMSVFIAIIVIFTATRPFLRAHPAVSAAHLRRVSVLWVAMTVVFEMALGLAGGRQASELRDAYAIWDGSLWPVVLVAVGAAPFVWLRRLEPTLIGKMKR